MFPSRPYMVYLCAEPLVGTLFTETSFSKEEFLGQIVTEIHTHTHTPYPALMNSLSDIFNNLFQETLCRTVPGHRGHSHIQCLPTPGHGAGAAAAGCVRQAVKHRKAQSHLGKCTGSCSRGKRATWTAPCHGMLGDTCAGRV